MHDKFTLTALDFFKCDVVERLSPQHRAKMGQFFTPLPVAKFMSSLCVATNPVIRILDAGAGAGILFTSCVAELCSRPNRPKCIEVIAYEAEPLFIEALNNALGLCKNICNEKDVNFIGKIKHTDFISEAVSFIKDDLFASEPDLFSIAILNPPYKKLKSNSEARGLLNSIGLETTNYYSAFVWLAACLLGKKGELVAITPRSFCNGPYFRNFRKSLLNLMSLDRIHVFESRDSIFRSDDVLQENVIFHAVKDVRKKKQVTISHSDNLDQDVTASSIDYEKVIFPTDPDYFIHIPSEDHSAIVSKRMACLPSTLQDLGLAISTGRVVDFRAKSHLRKSPEQGAYPLIYPVHFNDGFVNWPNPSARKPNALALSQETESLFVPEGFYVLTKRFSSKEEPRRIVAAIYDPDRIPSRFIGFENHINYFHKLGAGLEPALAKGLALYLNSTFVDDYFRQFNGHTQVNATDLRKIRYPSKAELRNLGSYVNGSVPDQQELDNIIERDLFINDQEKSLGAAD